MSALRKLLATCLCLGALLAAFGPGVAQASFGIKTLSATPTNREGTVEDRAGAHPYEYAVDVGMNLKEDAEETPEGTPEGTLSTVIVELPPGFVGDPLAVPRCPRALLEGSVPHCSPSSQIGIARVSQTVFGPGEFPIYNLVPPLGSPASLGVSIFSVNSFQEASVRTGKDYGVTVSAFTVPTGISIQSIRFSVWGVPNDQSHNPQRWCRKNETVVEGGCTSEYPPLPFLTLPTSCTGPMTTTVRVESVEQPGVPDEKSVQSVNGDGEPGGLRDCEAPPFDPTISAQPETGAADSPTGLHVHFKIPQTETPEGIATSHLKDTDLTLPAGLTLNPSAAGGLTACTAAQADLDGPGPANCPAASRVGTVSVQSPLLVDHPLPGSVYLAGQGDNPFGSLFALYIAVEDPLTGVIVKQAVKLEPDPGNGQLRALTAGLPQLPFEDLDFEFTGGPRAPLTTPQTCGSFTTGASLVPWARPDAPVQRSASFAITGGAGGGACPASEGAAPNAPSFEAGTVTPIAGSYSPFVLKLSRENGSQNLRALTLNLPSGLSAKFAGRTECSDAQIGQAEARRNPGEGALERRSPSCPPGSELGTVTVGAGSGAPFYVQGRAYLGGPYKGAPFSIVAITPAIAGPFDLGVVVVRSALYVNEETAQGTVKTDPIPTIVQGIPLQVRSIAIKVDNGDFTLNPTSCEAKAITGEAISPAGAVARLSNRFQVGACNGLEFEPQLKIQLNGATKRVGHPALKAVLTAKPGEANIARAQVNLPHGEFLDQGSLDKTCTKPVLLAGNCPASSVYGKVKAWTPLLEKPLQGNVYLVGGYGYKLPALVAELDGQIKILLVGKVDSGKNKGIRNTFEVVPDAPVSRFVLEMKGGKKYGLLENSENLCKASKADRQAIVRFTGQNGKVEHSKPVVTNDCRKSKGKGQKRHG